MPRGSRKIRAGLYYHVLNRGNNRHTIFHDEADLDLFIGLARGLQERQPLPITAVCLMPNHFHMVVRSDVDADVSQWLHLLLTRHASRHHRRWRSSGRIWTDRFRAFPIQDDRHLLTVVRYVERNPLRAGLVAAAEDWRWGSLNWRLEGAPWPLDPTPQPLPVRWRELVNAPQTASELSAIRQSVARGFPYGDGSWAMRTAAELGVPHCPKRRGRPPRRAKLGTGPE